MSIKGVQNDVEIMLLKLRPNFNVETTSCAGWVRLFDHLFDILNSRNPLAKGYKAPLCESNKHVWDPFLDEAYKYISGLKEPSGTPMTSSRRKAGFIGFLAAIKSTKGLF